MKSTLLLSPHLDDIALSCSDHAVSWAQQQTELHVLSIFTEFGDAGTASYQGRFITEQGFSNTVDYGEARRAEDKEAMQELGLDYSYLGELDAGFRRNSEGFLYEDYRDLTPWKVDCHSPEIVRRIAEHLAKISTRYEYVVIPLGVGGHIDHWITREAAETVWPASKRIYYLEFPYALRPWKYRPKLAKDILSHKISFMPFSSKKHDYLKPYKSQMPYLFRKQPSFREILLFQKQMLKGLFT